MSVETQLLQVVRDLGKFPNSFIYIITPLSMRSFLPAQAILMFAETLRRQAYIACALERYRLQKKEYPLSIEVSGVREFEDLPLDPFAENRPFHYERLTPQSHRLWSIGPDRENQNAVQTVPAKGETDDIIWQSASRP